MNQSILITVSCLLLILASCQDVDESDGKKSPVTIENFDEFQKEIEDITGEPLVISQAQAKASSCGDGSCGRGENKCSCEQDCGRCAGFASNLTQWKCVSGECALTKVEGICGNGLCEAGELASCRQDCPDCRDGNACTKDVFDPVAQKCAYTQITPCCGNSLCESSEDDRCLIDCPSSDNKNITLASYPFPFVSYPNFNANIVVGSNASAELVVAGIDIVRPLVFKQAGEGYSTNALLDTQVSSIENKNVILIGNACHNKFSRQLLLPLSNGECLDGQKQGEGLIRLYKTGDNTYAILVAGYAGSDVRIAAKVLGDFNASKTSRLSGLERRI
ncbi:hypothetical protein HY641_04115 [Candidatus Woesearchaeota archaeon]|nr:hypothetical protein [Candidatus Woesearchaeota archaeon]